MTMRKWWPRSFLLAGCVLAAVLIPGIGNAQYRGGTIKIGVLNDQSGLYADIAGTASVWMARKAVEGDTEAVVVKSGGKVLGKVRHPFPGTDFSSFLLQAKASKAKIIGLANAGGDTINSIKQASEFGIVEGGQKLAGLLIFINDIHALGLKTAQGLIFTDPWYWDQNDTNRAFAREYFAALGRMPGYTVVGVYSAVIHYLRAVEALGSHADGKAVIAKMKQLPTEDRLMGKGYVRIDGRKIHPMYLFEVKTPEESKAPWDYYKQLATIPAEEAWRPLDQSECPLAKK